MAHDRLVSSIRCLEVLENLSAYVDRELPHERAEQIEAHLRGCNWCERFGGEFSEAIAFLKSSAAAAQPVPGALRARLRARLRKEMEAHGGGR
jgi:anti-sigma factor (TIGR02949 family)